MTPCSKGGKKPGPPRGSTMLRGRACERRRGTYGNNRVVAASLPGTIRHGSRQAALHDLGRRRVTVDRGRHRDHKTKARQAFPAAGRGITTRTAPACILVCGPLAGATTPSTAASPPAGSAAPPRDMGRYDLRAQARTPATRRHVRHDHHPRPPSHALPAFTTALPGIRPMGGRCGSSPSAGGARPSAASTTQHQSTCPARCRSACGTASGSAVLTRSTPPRS